MVTKIMEWVCITALLLAVTWRPFASYQIALDFVVCAGSLMGILALFFIKHEMENHFDVDNRSNPAEASRCKTARVTVLSAPENAVEMLMANTIQCGNHADRGGRSFTGIPAIRKRAREIIRELRMTLENKQVKVPPTKNEMRKGA